MFSLWRGANIRDEFFPLSIGKITILCLIVGSTAEAVADRLAPVYQAAQGNVFRTCTARSSAKGAAMFDRFWRMKPGIWAAGAAMLMVLALAACDGEDSKTAQSDNGQSAPIEIPTPAPTDDQATDSQVDDGATAIDAPFGQVDDGATAMVAPFGGAEDLAYAADLWALITSDPVSGPGVERSSPYEGGMPHGAILEIINVSGDIAGHEGDLLVKWNYVGDGITTEMVVADRDQYLDSVTVMFKREAGYDTDNANWFWAKYAPDGTVMNNPAGMALAGRVAKGMEAGCIACHTNAPGDDYVFTEPTQDVADAADDGGEDAAAMAAPFGGAEDLAYAADLWALVTSDPVSGPGVERSSPYQGVLPHGEILEIINVSGDIAGHEGDLLVKWNYVGDGITTEMVVADRDQYLDSVTVMFKREAGYDTDNANWFWAKYAPDGTVMNNPAGMAMAGRVAKGMEAGCIACHTKAPGDDYVFAEPQEIVAPPPLFGGADDLAYAADLWAAVSSDAVSGPAVPRSSPYEGVMPHGEILEILDTTTEIFGHRGDLLVKWNYVGDGITTETVAADRDQYLDSVTVMFKREPGYDTDNANWFWAKYAPDGTVMNDPAGMALAGRVAKGMEAGCIACHTNAPGEDYVFTEPEDEPVSSAGTATLPSTDGQYDISGPARARDGGTILIDSGASQTVIRLWALAAPSLDQWPWGPWSRRYLDGLLANGEVGCRIESTSTGGSEDSSAARCNLISDASSDDLGALMIEAGHAVENRGEGGGVYRQAEDAAAQAGLGLWQSWTP